MPVERQFHAGRIEVALSGKLTPEELFGAFTESLDAVEAPPNAQLLVDVTTSDTLPPSEALRRIAWIIEDRRDNLGGRMAVLVAHDARYGLARQLGVWLEKCGIEVRPFRDRHAAVEWLDSSSPNPEVEGDA